LKKTKSRLKRVQDLGSCQSRGGSVERELENLCEKMRKRGREEEEIWGGEGGIYTWKLATL